MPHHQPAARRYRFIAIASSLAAALLPTAGARAGAGIELTQNTAEQAVELFEGGDRPKADKLLKDAIAASAGQAQQKGEFEIVSAMIQIRSGECAKARTTLSPLINSNVPQINAQANVMLLASKAAERAKAVGTSELNSSPGWQALLLEVRNGLEKSLEKTHADLRAAAKAENHAAFKPLRESSAAHCEQIEAIKLPGPAAKQGYRSRAETLADAVESLNQIIEGRVRNTRDINNQIAQIKGPPKGRGPRMQKDAAKLQQLLRQYNGECRDIKKCVDSIAPLVEAYRDLENKHAIKLPNAGRVRQSLPNNALPMERNQP